MRYKVIKCHFVHLQLVIPFLNALIMKILVKDDERRDMFLTFPKSKNDPLNILEDIVENVINRKSFLHIFVRSNKNFVEK